MAGDYAQKLRDPRWQKMRLKVMERDEFTCQVCFDSESTLNVHHRWYVWGKEPWAYPDHALLTLCESCHEQQGEMTKDFSTELLLMMKQGGAMGYEFSELCNVFNIAAQDPLSGHDWCILSFALWQLLESRHEDDGFWAVYAIAYADYCRAKARQMEPQTASG